MTPLRDDGGGVARRGTIGQMAESAATVRGGFVAWADDAIPDTAIDVPIRPLVATLNATGWARTVFSCAGHPEEPDAARTGRRQAHIDAVVRDERVWKAWVRLVTREAPVAVDAAMEAVAPRGSGRPPRVRVADGGLGPMPEWLAAALGPNDAAAPDPITRTLAAVATRLRLPWVPGPATPWRYRRLVLEPVPYDLEATACRALLDAAIGAAAAALTRVSAPAHGEPSRG